MEAAIEAAARALTILKNEPEEIWTANLKAFFPAKPISCNYTMMNCADHQRMRTIAKISISNPQQFLPLAKLALEPDALGDLKRRDQAPLSATSSRIRDVESLRQKRKQIER